jgi:hypothetical protein
VDLTSTTRAGYLGRRFDEVLATPDHDAWRVHSDTRLNAAFDAGDVRVVAYAGGSGTLYEDRTDGGRDLTRAALLAGVRGNLQMHRAWEAQGGWFQLDGLRHVVDLDVEFAGRFHDSHAPAEVPFFDRHDAARERSAAIVRVRNRLQTRRPGPRPAEPEDAVAPFLGVPTRTGGGIRTVADLELTWNQYVDRRGPYGRDTSGTVEATFRGEPRPGLDLAGDLEVDLDRGVTTVSVGAGVRTTLRDRPLAFFTGFRHVRDRSTSITGDVSWRFSEKYALRLLEVLDFDEGENLTRVLFRRYSPDHIWEFGVSVRNGDDVNLEISLELAIGGRTVEGAEAFKDEPDPNPWGAFTR